MSFDYEAFLPEIKEGLAEYGREITIVRYGSAQGSSQPWNNPTRPRADEATLAAVNVPPGSGLGLSTEQEALFADVDTIFIMEPDGDRDFREFDAVEDEGEVYHIDKVERLRPASTTLLWYIGANR